MEMGEKAFFTACMPGKESVHAKTCNKEKDSNTDVLRCGLEPSALAYAGLFFAHLSCCLPVSAVLGWKTVLV